MPTTDTGIVKLIAEWGTWVSGITFTVFGLGMANSKLMWKKTFYEEQAKCQAKICAQVEKIGETVTASNLKVAEHMGAVQQYMKEHMK